MKYSRKFKLAICSIIFAILVALDQFTKHLANINLKGKNPFVIIDGVFELNYLDGGNRGAAWGILPGKIGFFVILTVVICILIIFVLFKIEYLIQNNLGNKSKLTLLQIGFVILMAGAVGNLIDRVLNGYVVDFIYFKLINFPIFNVADCYITCSAVLLMIICIFFISDEEFSNIFSLKKKISAVESDD